MPVGFIPLDAATELDSVGTVFTQLTTWMGNMLTTITGHPILLFAVGIFAAGAVIGLVHRLIRG